MKRNLLNKVEGLYGSPSGFSKDRRRVYFILNKESSDVNKELTSIEEDVTTNFYVLSFGANTVVSMDV